jgi:hypothetical protein
MAMMKWRSSSEANLRSRANPANPRYSATHPTTFLVIVDVSAAAS